MESGDRDRAFAGSIPASYERYLVPLIFQPYAQDLASRAARRQPARVLELAAGTGVVTRELARTLPPGTPIVATDLNQPMLDHAAAVGTSRPVTWRQADALHLPFDTGSFDLVLCQFGVMFFGDRVQAYAEARRVLQAGGHLLFNVWDSLEHNAFPKAVSGALDALFPQDPPRFLSRVPYAYHDEALIAGELAAAGFDAPAEIETLRQESRADSARTAATAFCQGTPLRTEIESRSGTALQEATAAAAAELARHFGGGPISGRMQAKVISVSR